MLPEDQRRIDRERAIFLATRGADYSRLKQSIRAEKAAADANDASASRKWQEEYAGYITAVRERRIEPYPGGFRPAPGRRSHGRDDGFER